MYGESSRSDAVGRLLDALAEDATGRGVPAPVADEARRVAAGRFRAARRPSRPRVEAYFWGVIRRRALRGGASAMRQWLLMTSFVEELTAAGHAPSRVYEELRRVYGGMVEPCLLEAFRPGSSAHAA
jgi:hypothetical protein